MRKITNINTTSVSRLGGKLLPDDRDRLAPDLVMEIELTEPLPTLSDEEVRSRAWVLPRLLTEPIGWYAVPLNPGVTPDQLGALLWPRLRESLSKRFAAADMPEPGALTGKGLAVEADKWPFLRRRREVLAKAPFISVVICTRNRPDKLAVCLDLVEQQEYPSFEVLVVDNAPSSDTVRILLKERRSRVEVRYALEPRRGLSWAQTPGFQRRAGR